MTQFSDSPGSPEQIAGINLTHISNEPPLSYTGDVQVDFSERLVRRLDRATAAALQLADIDYIEVDKLSDSRIVQLTLQDDLGHTPAYDFLVSQNVANRIVAVRRAKGAEPSQDELLRIGLEEKQGAVEPNFSATALNALNASYYAAEPGFAGGRETGRGRFFTSNVPFNFALGALLAEHATDGHLRIKELCSGSDLEHWQYPAWAANTMGVDHLEVVLSDFVLPQIDTAPTLDYVHFLEEQYSLFEDMQPLPDKQKLDVILVTYGFDSVWQPEDISLSRIGDKWYQMLYRVKVADWNPRHEELLEAMRQGQPLPNASVEDYDGIVIEKAMQPFDIAEHPFGDYIIAYGKRRVNIPGGLIKRVVNAFNTQLKSDGVFINGDTGDFDSSENIPLYDSARTGVAARYRIDSYVLAQTILEQEFGLRVRLLKLEELIDQYLYLGLRKTAFTYDTYVRDINSLANAQANGLMIVTQKTE